MCKASCMRTGLPSGVLRERRIVVVDDAGLWIENDILEDGTKANSAKDIGLLLGRESYTLGITLNCIS
jgi:hypothetical protein